MQRENSKKKKNNVQKTYKHAYLGEQTQKMVKDEVVVKEELKVWSCQSLGNQTKATHLKCLGFSPPTYLQERRKCTFTILMHDKETAESLC